jgi:transglutaminase-like putative cysteine protease
MLVNVSLRLVTLIAICLQLWTLKAEIIYKNPRTYKVDYTFELRLAPGQINREEDLKLWIPVPREWESQRAVKILSVEPEPHAEYREPEHGNRMFFWDFGREPEKPTYKVSLQFRLASYQVHAKVEPGQVRHYEKTSGEYDLYTRSTHTINIVPKIKELAQRAVGNEHNPYFQAELIWQFVKKSMRYEIHRHDRGVGTKCLLDFAVKDMETGEEHYEGSCEQYSALFVALCRASGIPARTVAGFVGWHPGIKEEDLKIYFPIEREISSNGLAAAQHYMGLDLHTWAEFYLPNYGWIPAGIGEFGQASSKKIIVSKGRDVKIGPLVPEKQDNYGSQWIALHNDRVDLLRTGVFNISKIHTAKVTILHH